MLGVRILCVVVELPDNVATVPDFSKYFNSVRNTLTKKYAKFPYWKELGTFSVFLCKDKQYNLLVTEIKKFKDTSGWHMNVMLGTILINTDKLVFSDCLTWGLFVTGKHFETIKNAVSEWIMNKKSTF
jgi:putative heme iron utilization protein